MPRPAPLLLKLVTAVAATLLPASRADAIVPNPPPRVCTEYRASQFVFIGDVVGYRRLREIASSIDYEHVYRVRVIRRFKGNPPGIFTVYTSATSAGEQLDVGRRYILFVQRRMGRPVTFGGGNIRSGPAIAGIVKQLRAWRAHQSALASIRGRLDVTDGGLAPAKFIHVELTRRDGLRRRVRSDAAGWFVTTVPSGVWSARITEPGWTGRTGVYSFQDMDAMKLGRGGCADLEIEAIPPHGR